MELHVDLAFQLEAFSATQLCVLPAQRRLLAVGTAGEIRSLDLASGAELNSSSPGVGGSGVLCYHHGRSGKLVVVGGGRLGARGANGGCVMVESVLQTPREEPEDTASIELSLSEAEVLWNELKLQVLSGHSDSPVTSSKSKQLNTNLASVTAQLARGVRRVREGKEGNQLRNKWTTVSFEGPVGQLFNLFDHLRNRLTFKTPTPQIPPRGFQPPLSPALPLVAGISLRLRLLHPDLCTPLRQLEEGREVGNNELVHCEAVRRLSLRKWPHAQYLWAVPAAMAEAGFFQVAHPHPHLHSSSVAHSHKGDRVSCFSCHVYLYNWEAHDEPWSEHERHTFQCPFMRGEPTENIPLEVTEGSYPAVQVTSDPADTISLVSVSPHSDLVAVATKQGKLSVWNISGSFCILPRVQCDMSGRTLQSLIHTGNDEVTSFSITSLSLLSSPNHTLLVTTVTTNHSSSLVHWLVNMPRALPRPLSPAPQGASSAAPLEFFPDEPFPTDISPSTPPPLPTLTEDTPSHTVGSLSLISILPLFPDLHDNSEVQLTHPLTQSQLLALYVRHGSKVTEVKGDTNDPSQGSLVILRYTEEEGGRVAFVPAVTRVMEEGEVVDMCSVAMGDGVGVREVLVVVTTQGELEIINIESLEVMAVHRSCGGCGFVCCTAWSLVSSWVAVATREGRVEVVRVCELGIEGGREDVIGEQSQTELSQKCERERLSVNMINRLLSLTDTSPVGVVFSTSSTPQQWREISLQQYHRKVPTHMHSGRGSVVDDHTHSEGHTHQEDHTRVWKYLPPSSVSSQPVNSGHVFELVLPPDCPPLGCVSVRLSLPSPRCLGDSASLSLLLPPSSTGERGAGEESGSVLCGPVPLRPLVDVTGCAVQVSITHPLLLSPSLPPTLQLRLHDLFITDYSAVAMAAAETPQPLAKTGGLRRRGCIVKHSGGAPHRLQNQMNVNFRAVPDQCYLSLSLFPLSTPVHREGELSTPAHREGESSDREVDPTLERTAEESVSDKNGSLTQLSMEDLLRLREKRDFLVNLVLSVCEYRVVEQEFRELPQSLQCLVQGGEGGRERQLPSLRLLCWLCRLQGSVAEREGMEVLHEVVGGLMTSLLHSCFLASHTRQTAHLCTRLFISLFQREGQSQSAARFARRLLDSCQLLLPLLPLSPSAACVQWFLRVVAMVATRSHDRHVILQQCLVVLVELAKQLEKKTGHLTKLLNAKFDREGSVMDTNLYDSALSYYQRASLPPSPSSANPAVFFPTPYSSPSLNQWGAPQPHPPHQQTAVPTLVPPGVPPTGGQQIPAPQNAPTVVYTENKQQIIYDAELCLLLVPPPSSPAHLIKTLGKFPAFQQGSFLLYPQRSGLLETFPLLYTCCTVSSDAKIQELTYRNPTPSNSAHTSVVAMDTPKTSGYTYPSSSRTGPSSSVSCRTPKECPEELTKSEIIPRELLMVIDVLQSGKVYSAVLRFNQPVFLTDLCVSNNVAVGCVSVEVWSEGGEGVRVAQSTEIQERNLMLGNLSPPPLCQFVRVTYTARLGALREKAQVFLGAFYGIPLVAPGNPGGSEFLPSLERQLLSRYLSARQDLEAELEAAGGSTAGGGEKAVQERVREKYQVCHVAQTRLARVRHLVSVVTEGDAPGLIDLEGSEVDYATLSLSQLYRLAGCLVNTMLILVAPGEKEGDEGAPSFTDAVLGELEVTEDECRLLLSSLCVHGVLRVQGRMCALLLRLCGAQPWWGEMVVSTASHLFSSPTLIFNRKRALLQLSALCQRSLQQTSVLSSLLQTISSLLPHSSTSNHHHQLQWLLLLLTHSLSSLTSANHTHSHLFTPTLNVPLTSDSNWSPSPLKRRVRAKETISGMKGVSPSHSHPSPPPPAGRVQHTASIPFPLAHDVVRGLLTYCLSLTEQRNWVFLTVVCKAVSVLAELSSHPLHLTSLLTSSQLTRLLTTTLTPNQYRHHDNPTPSDDPGNRQWACQSIHWMVMSLVYHGDLRPLSVGGEMVARVNEKELPVREEAVVMEGEEGEEGEDEEEKYEKPPILPPHSQLDMWDTPTEVDLLGLVDDFDPSWSAKPFTVPEITTFPTLQSLTHPSDTFVHSLLLPPSVSMAMTSMLTPVPKSSSLSPPPIPPKLPIPKKKLSKHSIKTSSKYAPGDYTEFPDPAPSSAPESSPGNPYRLFLISSSVDLRLSHSLDLQSELAIQTIARDQYQSVLRALVTAAPPGEPPRETGEGVRGEGGLGEVCELLCESLEQLLGQSRESISDLVGLLQFWSGVHSLLARERRTRPLPENVSLCTPRLLRLLVECLSHAHCDHTHSRDATWQMGFSLLHHLLSPNTLTLHLHPSQLSQLLLAYFISCDEAPEMGVARGVVSDFLKLVLPLTLCGSGDKVSGEDVTSDAAESGDVRGDVGEVVTGVRGDVGEVVTGVKGDVGEVVTGVRGDVGEVVTGVRGDVGEVVTGVKGAHVLFEVLVELLEKRPSLLDTPLLHPLLETISDGSFPAHLFPRDSAPCSTGPAPFSTAVSCIQKLLKKVVNLVKSTRLSQSYHSVQLYSADVDATRYRYHNSSGPNQLNWQSVPLGTSDSAHHRSKVTADLLKLLKKLSCLMLSSSAHKAIWDVVGEKGQFSSPPMFPLMALVYCDSSLLHDFFSLLADPALSYKVPHPLGKTPPVVGKPPAPPTYLGTLVQEFLEVLYRMCPDRACFHAPLLSVLGSAPLSAPFFSFFTQVTSDLAADGNQLERFVRGGGARVVFECLCHPCSLPSSPSSLNHTLFSIRQPSSPSRDPAHPVNILPLAKLRLFPGHTPLNDLQLCRHGDPPSRTSSFHHTLRPQDEQITISISLPHSFLLSSLQLYQPLGLLQNGPSSILIETSAHPELAPPIPATPTLPTKGFGCLKVEFRAPVVAREVRVHLRRPVISDSISLSHMYLMGVGYGAGSAAGTAEGEGDTSQMSSSWVGVVDRWIDSCRTLVLDEAVGVPQLVPTYLSLITTHHDSLSLESTQKAVRFLISLGEHSPDIAETIIKDLMGLPGKATPTPTPSLVELLNQLCTPLSEQATQRLLLCLKVLAPVPETHSASLPVLVRALSSAVWHGDPKLVSDLLTEELFSSLADAAVSCPMESPLRNCLNHLLCALCSHTPHHFTLLLDRCVDALTSPSLPLLTPLLSTLSQVAHSPLCSPLLLSSTLLTSIITELTNTFSRLTNSPSTETDTNVLPRACVLLAFLTDLARDWTPAKAWLGGDGRSQLWPHLLQFISQAEGSLPPLELGFIQDVCVEFFHSVLQDSVESKVKFGQLLVDVLEETAPSLTSFTHRLIVDLVLDPEPCTLLLRPHTPEDTPTGSLPLTYTSPAFHPSLPVSRDSWLISVPHSLPLSHLDSLCRKTKPTTTADSGNSKTPPTTVPEQATPTASQPPKVLQHKSFQKKPTFQDLKRKLKIRHRIEKTEFVAFSLSSSPLHILSPVTKISELLPSISTPHPALSLQMHITTDRRPSPPHPSPKSHSPPSLLEVFAGCGGLPLISLCLPNLHPSLWPHPPSPSRHFTIPPPPITSSPHSLVTLGLCLKLRCYGDAFMEHPPMARTLLSRLLGSESKDDLTPAVVSEQLPFVPYLILLRILREQSVLDEVGVACREGVMRGGIINQLLSALSTLGHTPRGATPTSSSAQDSDSSSSSSHQSAPPPIPERGLKPTRNRLFWAKGTGFGTGSTTSTWNVDAMRAKQRTEEKHICLIFAILWECLTRPEGCGQGAEPQCDPALSDLLASSCLLPALATYLVNDSVLDIAKHTELYMSALGLLYSLTLHPSLITLLTLPIFTSRDSDGGLTLLSLSRKLKNTVLSYSKTSRFKTKVGAAAKATPTSGSKPLPLPVPPRRVRVKMNINPLSTEREKEPVSPEAELAELMSAMLATSERVVAAVSDLGGGGEVKGGDEGEITLDNNTTDQYYMQTMRPLQFDTYQFVEEDEQGRISVLVPFHYESFLKPSLSSAYGAGRARRLAQEVSALATSLPLSSSSSVFVRCDENRLDVMKVLITGPSDTPYANGCFEFDVVFPEEYPHSPMLVNLMTTGQGTVRFNPNLYNDGKVCLSVLNTWHGRPEEKWSSETSSFLQVLVSIQSLVLVPDPYFNEPGYEQYRGTQYGDQKSLLYNANLYVATVQWAMLNQLQNPSPCFREVILKHFQLRREEVLSQCRSWATSLSEGIKKMRGRGLATAPFSSFLHRLLKNIETLKTELGKVEKKLGVAGSVGGATVRGDSGEVVESSESHLGSSDGATIGAEIGTEGQCPELRDSCDTGDGVGTVDSTPDTSAGVHSTPDTSAGHSTIAGVHSTPDTIAGVHSTPDTGAGVHSTPDTGAGVHSTPDTSAGVHSTPDTIAGVHSTPDTIAGHSTPDTSAGVDSTPDASAGVHSTPDTSAGVHSTPDTSAGVHSTPDTTKEELIGEGQDSLTSLAGATVANDNQPAPAECDPSSATPTPDLTNQ